MLTKKGICVYISSKFSMNCEATLKILLFNVCHLQIGRVGTYRQVLHLTITVCRKLQDKVYYIIEILYCQYFFLHFNPFDAVDALKRSADHTRFSDL